MKVLKMPTFGRKQQPVLVHVTAAEIRIWKFINEWIVINSYAPTIGEISSAMRYKSHTFAARVIENLADKGALVRVPRLARAITIPKNIKLVMREKRNVDEGRSKKQAEALCS